MEKRKNLSDQELEKEIEKMLGLTKVEKLEMKVDGYIDLYTEKLSRYKDEDIKHCFREFLTILGSIQENVKQVKEEI